MSHLVTAIRLIVHSQRYQHLPERLTDCPDGWSFDHPFLGPVTVLAQHETGAVWLDINGVAHNVPPAGVEQASRDFLHWWR